MDKTSSPDSANLDSKETDVPSWNIDILQSESDSCSEASIQCQLNSTALSSSSNVINPCNIDFISPIKFSTDPNPADYAYKPYIEPGNTGDSVNESSTLYATTICPEVIALPEDIVSPPPKLTYEEIIYNKLSNKDMIMKLISVLAEYSFVEDFVDLVTGIAEQKFPASNIALRLLLDRVRFNNCTTTTEMNYSTESKMFWQGAYRLIHGRGILYFSGPKNAGQIWSQQALKGHYDPSKAIANFAVPDMKILREVIHDIPKIITPGIIKSALPLLSTDKEYVLNIDAKKISPGLDDTSGDIDLWGYEKPLSLEERKQRFNKFMSLLEPLKNHEESDVPTIYNSIKSILMESSQHICTLRQNVCTYERNRLKYIKLQENNPDNRDKYKLCLSEIKAFLVTTRVTIERYLKLNKLLGELLAIYNGVGNRFVKNNNVNLHHLFNCYLLKEPSSTTPIEFVKQRSPQWHENRNKSLVTGSTMHKAIGLETLKSQIQHFEEQILGKEKDISPDLQERLEYGRMNENNAIATLCTQFLPSITCSCQCFFEVGSTNIDTEEVKQIMSVSPDGLVTSMDTNHKCECNAILQNNPRVIEIKCPVEKSPTLCRQHYTVPSYYLCQVFSEMHAYKCKECLYMCYTQESSTLMQVKFDENTWQQMFELMTKIYGNEFPQKPNKLLPESKELRKAIKEVAKQVCTFLVEMPSVQGYIGNHTGSTYDGEIYYSKSLEQNIHISTADIGRKLEHAALEASSVFKEFNELTRQKAVELLMFVLADTDRIHSQYTPCQVPIAYVMKGYSLSNDVMRKMYDRVMDFLHENEIKVLCTSVDGQWSNFCTRDAQGQPLTLLQLNKQCWQDVCKLSKEALISKLSSKSSLPKSDIEDLESLLFCYNGSTPLCYTGSNVKVTSFLRTIHYGKYDIVFELESLSKIKGIRTSLKSERPDLWMQADSEASETNDAFDDVDWVLMEMLSKNYLEEAVSDIYDIMNIHCDADDIEVPHSDTAFHLHVPTIVQEIMSTILQKFVDNALQHSSEVYQRKWVNWTESELYHVLTSDVYKMNKHFIVKELDMVASVIEQFTNYKVYSDRPNALRKQEKIQKVLKIFGGTQEQYSSVLKVKSLSQLCLNILQSPRVPKVVLQETVAKLEMIDYYKEWKNRCRVPLSVPIPGQAEHKLFSYPEYSDAQEDIQPKIIDFTHVLTNLRTHCTQKGLENVKKEAFVYVCDNYPEVLTAAIVKDNSDQQNVGKALQVFSHKVGDIMIEGGFEETGKFVHLLRDWYDACDKRGLLPAERIQKLVAMHKWLLSNLDFNSFPSPGRYVKGIPIVTYEALLMNISMRILLYQYAINNTFNHRALSTLSVESFFADVTSMEFTGTGCPKATQIGRLLSHMLQLNIIRHDPTKGFHMQTTTRPTYPIAMPIQHEESDHSKEVAVIAGDGKQFMYRAHQFDRSYKPVASKNEKQHKQRTLIQKLMRSLKGVQTVRQIRYKDDESRRLVTHRVGIKDD